MVVVRGDRRAPGGKNRIDLRRATGNNFLDAILLHVGRVASILASIASVRGDFFTAPEDSFVAHCRGITLEASACASW